METQSQKAPSRPGNGLIITGLAVAGLSLLILILAISGGGTATAFTAGGVIVGLIVAAIGFGRRVIVALEKR